jgi:ribosomal protein S18 acetylase RimI-like enzyme
MVMDIAIRQAMSSDFDQVGRVFAEENRFHAALLPERFQIAEPIMTHEWFGEILTNPRKALLVAERAGEIVGLVLVTIKTNPDDPIFQPRRYGYIDEIAVAEQVRGQGIGRLLMKEAHTWAFEQGASEVELHVWEANQPAIVFYERLGYIAIQRTMKVVLPGAEFHLFKENSPNEKS